MKIEPKAIPVSGRHVVIVDDIISTGGTQATAARMLFEQGASSISTICVHGVLATGAYTHLISAGVCGVSSSDTIESACSSYTAAGIIVNELRT